MSTTLHPSAPRHAALREISWEEAFEAHYVGLCEYVLRLVGSADVAEDLIQDLFLYLWSEGEPPAAGQLTPPYLYVAARNRALRYLRHQRVVAAWVERAARLPDPEPDTPEDLCLSGELDRAVRSAIAALPPRCREIFVLRRRDQLGYHDIAARLGVSLGTVKSQMWRATVQLRDRLHTAGVLGSS
jgi:RNA polymerase sigma-70 factor (ECF subfamily)